MSYEPNPIEESDIDALTADPDPPVALFDRSGSLALEAQSKPWWLTDPPPKKIKGQWPKGARSASWTKLAGLCLQRHAWKYRYRRPDPTGLDALIGSAIHGALEDAGRRRLRPAKPGLPRAASPDELLHLLEYQPEILEDPGTEAMRRSREVISSMPPANFDNVWAVEYLWQFSVTYNLRIAGYADLIQVVPDPRGIQFPPVMVVVTDYKTGMGQLPSREELEHDVQAGYYLAWARRQWPNTPKIRFRIWNVNLDKEIYADWTNHTEDLILSYARAAQHAWNAKRETPTVGQHCTYCPYRKECTAYTKYLNDAKKALARSPEHLDNLGIEQLAPLYNEAKTLASLSETRRKDISERILELLGNQSKYETQLVRIRKRSNSKTSYRSAANIVGALAEITGQSPGTLMDTVCSISLNKLNALVKSLSDDQLQRAQAMLEVNATQGRTSPWVEVQEKEGVF